MPNTPSFLARPIDNKPPSVEPARNSTTGATTPIDAPRLERRGTAPRNEQGSLFGEILDWMFAPLLLLWPMSVAFTYLVAQSLANPPYDRLLSERAEQLGDYVKLIADPQALRDDQILRDALRVDPGEGVVFSVNDGAGRLLAGDRNLPPPPDDAAEAPAAATVIDGVSLRNDLLRGADVRVAHLRIKLRDGEQMVRIQVAEPLTERKALANEIIRGVIIPQFVVLPLAVLLVWFGLSRGLKPLEQLQERIRARKADDLSPIDPTAAPIEMAPLVASFNELLARLQRNLQTQNRFIADAAHQLKTPLAGLRTQAELAQRENDPAELQRSLRHLAASTERATRLVNQLLALARAEHEAASHGAFAVVDLAAVAREAVREWVPQAVVRGIDLGVEAAMPAPIVGVPLMLREMLGNLIDNAIRYAPAHATVTVRVRRAAAAIDAPVVLEVEDTGPGIPEPERMLVFERFYRVLGTGIDGSGLGLAIVREIVNQHEASLHLTSNPRAAEPGWPGTLIAIEFPSATEETDDGTDKD